MEEDIKPDRQWPNKNRHERVSGGFVLLLIGGALLARQLGAPLPDWLFTWPVILIIVGLFMGIKFQFRTGIWLVPIFVGGVFLADQVVPGINLKPFIFPLVIILVGILFILKPKSQAWQQCKGSRKRRDVFNAASLSGEMPSFIPDRSDFIETTSIFSGIKKVVLSKNFRGGDITNIMGGSEIDLTQADFTGRIHIDTTNIFGGTKLIVPSHWNVQSDVVAVFGGVDDKRRHNGNPQDPEKIMVLDGTVLFGGIEISSY
ncbi:MAG TPA: LiaF domain-containing protein [Chitinophagaceae bacterium]|nr:LiaF domain-containing protein [Chitinophagaceae bacterium]